MSLSISSAAQSVIAEHQAFIAIEDRFPGRRRSDARRVQQSLPVRRAAMTKPVTTVRTWFTVWESARIADALRAVATRHLDRDVTAAARRLIGQRRLWWLHAIDARLSGLHPQRLLNVYETEALVVALRIARATAVAVERQLADDFDVSGGFDGDGEFNGDVDSTDRDADHDNGA